MRKKGSLSVYLSVCLSVCLSVSEKTWIFYVWKYLNLIWWTIWKLYFRWINKGRKDSFQKGTSLIRFHTRFLISLHAPKLLSDKSWNKESVVSRPMNKNKVMWYFFHNQSQFPSVTEKTLNVRFLEDISQ